MKEKRSAKAKKSTRSFARFLCDVTDRVYSALARSALGRFFSAYSVSDAALQNTMAARAWHARRRKQGKTSLRKGVARAMDRSRARAGLRKVLELACTCSLRTVGALLLTSGLYYAIVHWLILAVWQGGTLDPIGIFFAFGALVLGAMLLCSNASIGYAVTSSAIGGWFLRVILGLSEDILSDMPREGRQTFVLTVPFGMLLGALTALVGPARLCVALLVALLSLMIFSVPEAGVLLLILFAPFGGFLPYTTLWLALASVLVLAGYFFKLMRGTRAFRMEIQDLAVLGMILFMLLLALTARRGAYMGVVGAVALMAVYFPVVNMISTPRWLARCRWALISGATGAATLAILQFVIAAVGASQGAARVDIMALGEVVRAGFADAATFAYFMVLAFPFALYGFLRARTRHRIFAGLACVAMVTATALTFVQSAWLAIVVELVVMCFVYGKRFVPYMLATIAVTPGVVALLPAAWRAQASHVLLARSDLSFARMHTAGELMSRVYFEKGEGFFGIGRGLLRLLFGLGEGGMETICVLYTATPAREIVSSFNFWMQGLADGGVLGVILPALFFFLFLQNCLSIIRHTHDMDDHVLALVGVVMLWGVLTLSLFRYTWYDPAALLLFFLVTALITADARYHRSRDIPVEEALNNESYVEVDYEIVEPAPIRAEKGTEPRVRKEKKAKKAKKAPKEKKASKRSSAKQGGSQ